MRRLFTLILAATLAMPIVARAAPTLTFQCADPSGATTTSCDAYLDPDFHAGDSGTLLYHASGATKATIALPSGDHRVVIKAAATTSAGTNSSVMVVQTQPTACPLPGWTRLAWQSWWSDPGERAPGRHIHINAVCWPVNNKIVDGRHTFTIPIELHAQPAGSRLTRVRLKDYCSGTACAIGGHGSGYDAWAPTIQKQLPSTGGSLTDAYTATLDLATAKAGRHEFRWGVYVTGPNGKVQLLSTRAEICIRSCSPYYRSGTYQGNGSWYANDSPIGYIDVRAYDPIPVP